MRTYTEYMTYDLTTICARRFLRAVYALPIGADAPEWMLRNETHLKAVMRATNEARDTAWVRYVLSQCV